MITSGKRRIADLLESVRRHPARRRIRSGRWARAGKRWSCATRVGIHQPLSRGSPCPPISAGTCAAGWASSSSATGRISTRATTAARCRAPAAQCGGQSLQYQLVALGPRDTVAHPASEPLAGIQQGRLLFPRACSMRGVSAAARCARGVPRYATRAEVGGAGRWDNLKLQPAPQGEHVALERSGAPGCARAGLEPRDRGLTDPEALRQGSACDTPRRSRKRTRASSTRNAVRAASTSARSSGRAPIC